MTDDEIGQSADGMDRFRCEDCGTPKAPTGVPKCEECGGRVREYVPMTAPLYKVRIPGLTTLWFSEGEYSAAFEHATGETVEEAGNGHDLESEISIVEFDGVVEVPVAHV